MTRHLPYWARIWGLGREHIFGVCVVTFDSWHRIEGAHTPSHEHAGPAGAALLWIHVHLRDPTSVAHLSHVFAP